MKYLKIFEEFTEFQLDEISKQEYYSILYNRLVYIPESKVLEFKSKLSKEYKLVYGRSHVKDAVEFFRVGYETEVDYHITDKTFSIRKRSLGGDEPCYVLSYNYEEFTSFAAPKSNIETLPDQKRIGFQKKSYYRFEESDFNKMCENPQILLDYLDKNNMIKESFEYDEEKHIKKICKGWGLEAEDLEDLFIDFSDDGGKVLFSYMFGGIIQITIKDIWKDLNNDDWLYNPLWNVRFWEIKRQLNRMGLDMNVIERNHGRYTNVRIFPMSDRKRTHSKTDIVKESFEVEMGTHDMLSDYGLTMDDIEELFLEFSDMGYHIKMMPRSISIPTGAFRYRNDHNGLIVYVVGLGAKSHEPEISSLIRKVIKNSEKLGLNMVESPKRVTQFMRPPNVKFIFKKG